MNSKNAYLELKLARGLVFFQDHILLVKNNLPGQGHLFLPGGKVDPGEAVETALIREFKEELDWTIEAEKFVGCFEQKWVEKKKKSDQFSDVLEINFLFLVKRLDQKLNLQDPPSMEKKLTFHWVKLDQISNVHFLPKKLASEIPKIKLQLDQGLQTFWGSGI